MNPPSRCFALAALLSAQAALASSVSIDFGTTLPSGNLGAATVIEGVALTASGSIFLSPDSGFSGGLGIVGGATNFGMDIIDGAEWLLITFVAGGASTASLSIPGTTGVGPHALITVFDLLGDVLVSDVQVGGTSTPSFDFGTAIGSIRIAGGGDGRGVLLGQLDYTAVSMPVPEPSGMLLLVTALGAAAAANRRTPARSVPAA